MKTATVYFSCGDRYLHLTDTIRYTTLRGAKIALRNSIRRNFINAAAIYGNFARFKAVVAEGCDTILISTFGVGDFA